MTAFSASYADLKVIKTRKCVQIIFELPIENFDAAYEVLGGLPNSSTERWFGIAAIKESAAPSCAVAKPQPVPDKPQAGAKRSWRDLPPAQQAGIRCEEVAFRRFLEEERPDDWHEEQDPVDCLYLICGIRSRSELNTNQKARVIWHQLNDQYEAWMRICA